MDLRPKLLKGFPPLFEAVKGMLPRNLLRNNWLRRQEQLIEHWQMLVCNGYCTVNCLRPVLKALLLPWCDSSVQSSALVDSNLHPWQKLTTQALGHSASSCSSAEKVRLFASATSVAFCTSQRHFFFLWHLMTTMTLGLKCSPTPSHLKRRHVVDFGHVHFVSGSITLSFFCAANGNAVLLCRRHANQSDH